MEMTAEQLLIIENKASRAWLNSKVDAVEDGDYGERLTRTRLVYSQAYVEGFKQAQAEHAASHLSFGDALVLRACMNDITNAEQRLIESAAAMRAALGPLTSNA